MEQFDTKDISEESVGIPDSSNISDTGKYLSSEVWKAIGDIRSKYNRDKPQ